MNRESFVFYKSFTESIGEIENAETRGKAYETIAFYALFGQEPTKDCEESVRVIFRQAKALLDKSQARYEKCKENGKKGGRPKKNKNQEITKTKPKDKPKTNQEETKTKANHNLNVDVDDDVNVDVNVNEEREKQVKEFFNSLSHKYPKIEINIKTINPDYDLDKILNAIKQSKYLQNAPLSFIIKNYEKVITSYYKSFDNDKNKPFISRDYSKEKDLLDYFDDVDKINL